MVYINWPSQAFSRIQLLDLVNALQWSHPDSFSGLPVGHLSGNISLTDPKREERIAGGLRPGLVLPHPRTACPDTRLELDAALPEAAAISHAERPPTVLDIPETGHLETTHCPEPSHRRGSRSPRLHSRSSALYRPKKRPTHPGHWCEYLASPGISKESLDAPV